MGQRKLTLTAISILSFALYGCGTFSNLPSPSGLDTIIEDPGYKEVRVIDKPIVIKWNFNKNPNTLYHYSQKTLSTNRSTISSDHTETASEVDAQGLINVRQIPRDEEFQTYVIVKNKRSLLTSWTPSLEKPLSTPSKAPLSVLEGLQQDGSFKPSLPSQYSAWGYLFSLPKTAIKKGQTITMPVEFPVNAYEKTLIAKGNVTMTLSRFVRIGDRVCAQLDVKQDATYANLSEFDGEFNYKSDLSTRVFFDVLAGRIHSAYMDMSLFTETNNQDVMLQVPGGSAKRGLNVVTEGRTLLTITPYTQAQQ